MPRRRGHSPYQLPFEFGARESEDPAVYRAVLMAGHFFVLLSPRTELEPGRYHIQVGKNQRIVAKAHFTVSTLSPSAGLTRAAMVDAPMSDMSRPLQHAQKFHPELLGKVPWRVGGRTTDRKVNVAEGYSTTFPADGILTLHVF